MLYEKNKLFKANNNIKHNLNIYIHFHSLILLFRMFSILFNRIF
jgi:hypothetical protein